MKIVSLFPSATEIICCLGLEKHLAGVTHECNYPASVRKLPEVTQTLIPSDATSREIDTKVRGQMQGDKALYSLDMTALQNIQPDLIITQALCDVCAVPDQEVENAVCSLPGDPSVIKLEPQMLEDVFISIYKVAEVTPVTNSAVENVVGKLRSRVNSVSERTKTLAHRPRVALLEWLDPPFSCGHWSPGLVRMAGGIEGLGKEGQPSRTLTWGEVQKGRPEIIFIACCGYRIQRTLQDISALRTNDVWQNLEAVCTGNVYLVDGSKYFSRPGPRLIDSLEILAHTLHPELHPLPGGLTAAYRVQVPKSITV